jgi:hypothetical protein
MTRMCGQPSKLVLCPGGQAATSSDGTGSRRITGRAKAQITPNDWTDLDDLRRGRACLLVRGSNTHGAAESAANSLDPAGYRSTGLHWPGGQPPGPAWPASRAPGPRTAGTRVEKDAPAPPSGAGASSRPGQPEQDHLPPRLRRAQAASTGITPIAITADTSSTSGNHDSHLLIRVAPGSLSRGEPAGPATGQHGPHGQADPMYPRDMADTGQVKAEEMAG